MTSSLVLRPGRRLVGWLLLALLALSSLANAGARAPQQAFAIEVPGLGPLVLIGRDPASAVRNYVEGLVRRGMFPGSEKALRAWGRTLDVAHAKPVSTLASGAPVTGLQINSLADLTGLTRRARAPKALLDATTEIGMQPLFLPVGDARKNIGKHLGLLDHLLVMGGPDVHPTAYGRPVTYAHVAELNLARDRYELALISQANARKMPITGICRGHQLLGVESGGELVQDLALDGVTQTPHAGEGFVPMDHAVKVVPGSKLAKLLGATKLDAMPSMHHESIAKVGPSLQIVGWSPDGVVESVEGDGGRVHGYQFHPEAKPLSDPQTKAIFRDIKRRATKYRLAKR